MRAIVELSSEEFNQNEAMCTLKQNEFMLSLKGYIFTRKFANTGWWEMDIMVVIH